VAVSVRRTFKFSRLILFSLFQQNMGVVSFEERRSAAAVQNAVALSDEFLLAEASIYWPIAPTHITGNIGNI
jgi:hypothetical protein